MAKFGQGVNAQLGAISYDDYLRGAMSGSQMTAQGNAAIGQGIGAGLQAIEKGMETRAEINSVVNSTKKLLSGFEDLTSIPEDTKKQMRSYLTQLDSPDLTDRDRGALAKQLGSYANVIVGEGFKKSFENDKNAKVAEILKGAYTQQTPEQSIASFNNTLAGKPQEAFTPQLDQAKLLQLASVMPGNEAAALINAVTNSEVANRKAYDPRIASQIELNKARIAALNRSNQPKAGHETPDKAMEGRDPAFYEAIAANGAFFATPKKYAANGTTGVFNIPGIGERTLIWVNGDLMDKTTGLLVYNKADITGEFKPTSVNPAFFESVTGKKLGSGGIEIPESSINKNVIKLRLGNNGIVGR